MFERKIEKNLIDWQNRPGRKPLVIRGARQTGKTTLVRKFAERFDAFIELNLEKDAVRRIFSEVRDIPGVIRSIEGAVRKRVVPGSTLLFIDEIQNSVPAIKLLRYFHEEVPDLHVVAAGSLLEVRMRSEGWSFPVGRVEFLYLYPASFDEFLAACGEKTLLDELNGTEIGRDLPPPLHDRLLTLLFEYMAVGGMPEAVAGYVKSGSLLAARRCHEELSASFKEDFAKYAKASETEWLKLVWDRAPFEIGSRLTYSRLGGSEVRSRDISRAFDILHEAMLVELIRPTTRTALPLVKKPKAAPKAQFLDVGLVTHALDLTGDQIRDRLIASVFSGGLAEAYVGQELLALDVHRRSPLHFWVREEKDTSSELDFVVARGGGIVPIEVKSSSHGSLRSLHQFLHRSGSDLGVRVSSGPLRLESHSVALPDGKPLRYRLLSVPFYLISRLMDLCRP